MEAWKTAGKLEDLRTATCSSSPKAIWDWGRGSVVSCKICVHDTRVQFPALPNQNKAEALSETKIPLAL